MVTRRKGDIMSMETQNDRINIEFVIPSRGIIGLRNNVLTGTVSEAITWLTVSLNTSLGKGT